MSNLFRQVLSVLSNTQRQRSVLIMLGILLISILDVMGLAILLPVITVVADPELVYENEYLNKAYTQLAFTHTDNFLLALVGLLLGTFLLKNSIAILVQYYQTKFTYGVASNLSKQMFLFYFNKPYLDIKNIDSGKFIADIKNIPNFFAKGILLPLISIISEVLIVLLVMVGIAVVDWKVLLSVVAVIGGGFAAIYLTVRKRATALGEERKILMPKVISSINEALSGYVDITIFQQIPFFLKRYQQLQNREYELNRQMVFLSQIPPRTNETFIILGVSLVFLYGLILDPGSRGDLFLLLSVMAAAAFRVMPSANRILAALMMIRNNAYTLDILAPLTKHAASASTHVAQALSFDDQIQVENLSFQFEDGDKAVIKDLNLTISKGSCVGLIGESGSGKTTLMRILLRLFRETGGHLRIDQTIISPANEAQWQKKIGIVQQDVFIMNGSIRDNLTFGIEEELIDEEKLSYIIQQVGLTEMVHQMPEGLNTLIGEKGSRLSGGQKQRLTIARALYQDAEFFIFDEITSALDTETEEGIIQAIQTLSQQGKTILIIAHRLTTLKYCDQIYELQAGEIAHVYDYPSLLKTKLGLVKDA